MTRKEIAAKKSELCAMYTNAIDDFRKFFENKKKLMKAKNGKKEEKSEEEESEET